MAYVQQTFCKRSVGKNFGGWFKIFAHRLSLVNIVSYQSKTWKEADVQEETINHLLFQSIVPTSQIKQCWAMFLSSNDNKNALVKFIASEWKEPENLAVIGRKSLFVKDGQKVFNIKEETVIEIPELESNHEEAGTRIILHPQHASQQYQKIVISSPDTDVFVICLSFKPIISANLYFPTGVKNSRRLIDISAVVGSIDQTLNVCKSPRETLLKSLIGLHSFTGFVCFC